MDCFRATSILVTGAMAIATAGYAQAQPRPLNLPPHLPPGKDVCFGRVYDAKHLAAHPKQRVTSFYLFRDFSADTNAEEAPILTEKDRATDNPVNVGLTAYVSFRDRPGVFSNWLVCYRRPDGSVRCGVEYDGGGSKLRTSGSTLIAENQGFVVSGGCGASDDQEDEQVFVRPGADDRVFRLDKLPLAACKAARDSLKPAGPSSARPSACVSRAAKASAMHAATTRAISRANPSNASAASPFRFRRATRRTRTRRRQR